MAALNIYDIIIKPVLTEKSMSMMENKEYTFLVHPDANKQMIATNRQMLSILKAMDVSTGNIVKAGEDIDQL